MNKSDAGAQRILVVEDEPAICDLCRRVLSGEGFEVDTTINGKIAQDMIGEKQYDLFLIDIRLPLVNGIEFYRWLQNKHPQLASRVIFSTGSVIGQDISTLLEQSGRPWLPKPFIPDELKAIVKETLKEVEK